MFGCGPKYFSERLKLKRVYKTLCAVNCERITQVQHKMFKTIHNAVNIFLTEIIVSL